MGRIGEDRRHWGVAMKETARRKDLIREYKEKKARPGVFAVRCATTGESWVGSSRNLDTQKNGIWFQLRAGSYVNTELLASWKKHGENCFSFDELEVVEDENTQLIDLLLKDRAAHWREKLGARKLVG
jgi:hypothetical protein